MMKTWVRLGGLVGGVSASLMMWACSSPERDLLSSDDGPDIPRGFNLGTGGASAATATSTSGSCIPSVGLGGASGGGSVAPAELIEPERRPPALSGGTLIASADGTRAIAADPDRDRVYFVDVTGDATPGLLGQIVLSEGAEPGRLVEDGEGNVHVALRGTGEVVSIDIESMQVTHARAVCDHPRGIAHDAATGLLHVACAEGLLKSLPASGGGVGRVLNLGQDLRDVIVQGDELFVSRFRSAELLRVTPDNEIALTTSPKSLRAEVQICADPSAPEAGNSSEWREFEAHTAWRTIGWGTYQAIMVHQRHQLTELSLDEGAADSGYNAQGCAGMMQSVVTVLSAYGETGAFPSLPGAVLPVDVAMAPDQRRFAVVGAGSHEGSGNVFFVDMDSHTEGAKPEGWTTDVNSTCAEEVDMLSLAGQPTSVAYLPDDRPMVLTRQPARLYVINAEQAGMFYADLSDVDVTDTGHELFHRDAGAGIACASCHPEARDDGHVWSFEGMGPRRTQSVRGGILGSEPFHWEGDMVDFGHLVNEVMVGRMKGPRLTAEHIDSLAHWIDAQPALTRTNYDEEAVARGRELFESNETGCATCHSGAKFTNNATVNVGTGLALQVPSLTGVSFRAPYLHDGCASSLLARFGECGGGDLHGRTSQLSDNQLDDLVEYMKSL